MGWFDDVVGGIGDVVSGVGSWFGNNKWAGNVLSTVVTGYALNQVNDAIQKDNDKQQVANTRTINPTDMGVLLQLPPNQDNKIPVVYGTAVVAGIITDAHMTADRSKMIYVVTICERTGTGISGSGLSTITLDEVYWNRNKVIFKPDGVTIDYTVDSDGNQDHNQKDLVKIYKFPPNSATFAQSIVPNWDNNYTMNELVFAVIEVTYNKSKGVVGVPNTTFKVTNSCTLPGDVLFDYMTNTRYGAGIPAEDIYSQ